MKRPKAIGFGPITCRTIPEATRRAEQVWRLVSGVMPDLGNQRESAKDPSPAITLT